MLLTLAISGYRSIRELVLPLERLTVVTGPNGSGKSNLYRAIRLLAEVAQGRVIGALAREGGLQSTLWAGPEQVSRAMKRGEVPVQGLLRRDRVRLRLGFASADYGYAIDLGLPQASGGSLFNHDPEIKAEAIWAGPFLRRANELASRRGPHVRIRDGAGGTRTVFNDCAGYDSMIAQAADPRNAPELMELRERMRQWRFYDHLRADPEAPAREAQIGTRTLRLAADGADLAAAFRTVEEIGDPAALHGAIEDAFPGSAASVAATGDGRLELTLRQHGLLRPLHARELSDGTLRYLLLAVALLSPRPAPLIVLNEPETSLHPSLIEPLARLVAAAAKLSQIVVVSHQPQLVERLRGGDEVATYRLHKELGETAIDGLDRPKWTWPER